MKIADDFKSCLLLGLSGFNLCISFALVFQCCCLTTQVGVTIRCFCPVLSCSAESTNLATEAVFPHADVCGFKMAA